MKLLFPFSHHAFQYSMTSTKALGSNLPPGMGAPTPTRAALLSLLGRLGHSPGGKGTKSVPGSVFPGRLTCGPPLLNGLRRSPDSFLLSESLLTYGFDALDMFRRKKKKSSQMPDTTWKDGRLSL